MLNTEVESKQNMLNIEVESKLKKILIDILGNATLVEAVNLDDNLDEVWVNSINFVKICVLIEVTFSFEFDDDALNVSYFKTLRNLITYIESKIEPGNTLPADQKDTP